MATNTHSAQQVAPPESGKPDLDVEMYEHYDKKGDEAAETTIDRDIERRYRTTALDKLHAGH